MTGSHEVRGSIPRSSTQRNQRVSQFWLTLFSLDCAGTVRVLGKIFLERDHGRGGRLLGEIVNQTLRGLLQVCLADDIVPVEYRACFMPGHTHRYLIWHTSSHQIAYCRSS